MAVTITPQNPIGRDGASLNMTAAQDPTFVEVPRLPVMIVVARQSAGSASIEVVHQKDITTLPQRGTQFQRSTNFGSNTVHLDAPYFLIVQPHLSEVIIDTSGSTPRVEISGADIANCEVGAFEFTTIPS